MLNMARRHRPSRSAYDKRLAPTTNLTRHGYDTGGDVLASAERHGEPFRL